eukprot:scaffold954_cov173-Ochromonas_danica.AAC.40
MALVNRPINEEAQDEAQVTGDLVPSKEVAHSDLPLTLPTLSGIKSFVLDISWKSEIQNQMVPALPCLTHVRLDLLSIACHARS